MCRNKERTIEDEAAGLLPMIFNLKRLAARPFI